MSKTENLDFNFGAGGDIFGEFTPDLSSLQKVDDTTDDDGVENIDTILPVENELPPIDLEDEESEESSEESHDDSDQSDSDETTDEDLDTDDSDSEDDNVENVSYKAIADYLAENGILDGLDEYEGEDTPEVLEHAVRNTAVNLVNSYKESIPEVGKQFLDYVEKGGDPSKFFQSLERPIDFETVDMTDEKNQKRIYEEYLKSLDWTPEEISEELQDVEDNLLLERKAKVAKGKLEKIHADRQQRLLQEQEQLVEQQREQYNQYISTIRSTINDSSSIAGLTVSPSDKKEFERYLLETDSEGMTKYSRELNEDPVKTQLELAYLKFKKYDFSKVVKQATTEATKKIRGIIKDSDKRSARSPQVSRENKSGDLSAFKSQLF